MLNYFRECRTLEELKKEYRKLAMKWHPDVNGGNTEKMQEINGEYDKVFPQLKNKHVNKEGETYEKENNEEPAEFKDLIDKLMRMEGVKIEVIGCFVWLSGETKAHKDELKALGFRWHSKKLMWYKAPEGYKRYGKKQYGMDEIRGMYGVDYEANAKTTVKLEQGA